MRTHKHVGREQSDEEEIKDMKLWG